MNTELSAKATEIADYAQSLLALGGYNSFSYADIAERVRITKASIHHHFPSKASWSASWSPGIASKRGKAWRR
ncbi:TetR family transcriptional regulator [Pseudomonas sp. PCH446]